MRWLILQAENSNRRLQADLSALRQWVGADWPSDYERLSIHTLESDADRFLSLAISRLTRARNPQRSPIVLYHVLAGKAGAARGVPGSDPQKIPQSPRSKCGESPASGQGFPRDAPGNDRSLNAPIGNH